MARKNLRKVPQEVLDKITSFEVDDIVVACAKRVRAADVPSYAHTGLKLEGGRLVIPAPTVPPESMGRYSNINVNGREVVRKDLPMVSKTFSWEVPNYGDWSNGSHTQSISRDVYQRDLVPPKELTLAVELIAEDPAAGTYTIKFSIDQVISRRAKDFEADLLYNLNILQENVHTVDVFPSTATLVDYMATVRVDWEILPPGTVDEVLKGILHGKKAISAEKQQLMRERLTVLRGLKPEAYIAGTNEFLRYFGAKFADDFVAFENLNYGNALYVMYEQWTTLSRRSRIDLLKGPREGFVRIEHRDGWDGQLAALLQEYRDRAKK